MNLDKLEFEDLLISEGYVCEKDAQYPSVIVYGKGDIRKTYRLIHALSKEKGYGSSFAVRLFHEGMSVYSRAGDDPVSMADDGARLGDISEHDDIENIREDMPAAEADQTVNEDTSQLSMFDMMGLMGGMGA